jgi:serine/threonine protein kinase
MQYIEGNVIDGRYILERLIGNGSFGEVWVAKDNRTDVEVAIKIYVAMDQQGLDDFRKEFQLSFNLNHTNLLHANYLGINQEDNRPFLVMPYCPRGSVSRYAGEMTEMELWHFIKDVSAGLSYLHLQDPPIIHQDIKPDNILLLQNGSYVVTDFGISKQLRRSLKRSASLNSAGAISYMGPERFSKNYQTIKASDIWSLGVAIYELATGELPFAGMGGSLQKQGAEIPDLPGYSPQLNTLLAGCLAKDTWDRPTAQQINEYATACLKGGNPEATWLMPAASPQNSREPQSSSVTMETVVKEEPAVYPYPHESITYAAYDKKETVKSKSIPAWVYGAVSFVGLVVGFLLSRVF